MVRSISGDSSSHGSSISSNRSRGSARPPTPRNKSCALILAGIFVICVVVAVSVAVTQLNEADKSINSDNSNNNAAPVARTATPTAAPAVITAAPTLTLAPTVPGYQACNGLESLCDVRANELIYATLHNAVSSAEDGVNFLPNHELQLEKALFAGWRGVNFDVGKCTEFADQPVRLVHGTCGLGTRDPVVVLSNILAFLRNRVNEVLLIPVQIDNTLDGGAVTLAEIYAVMKLVSGFTDMLYQHVSGAPWPTLRELIANNTRILFFHYNGNETCSNTACPAGFHDWFTYAAETRYEFDGVSAVEATNTSCAITRGQRGRRDFFGVNMFTTLPSPGTCEQLNAASFVATHLQACADLNRPLRPTLVLVDYWSIGNVLEVVNGINAQIAAATVRSAEISLLILSSSSSASGGISSEMSATEQASFLSTCSAYFRAQLASNTGLSNVYCSNLVSQTVVSLSQRRRRRTQGARALQTTTQQALQVTVLVQGDDAGGNSASFATADLEAVVDATSDAFVASLSVQGDFFSSVTQILTITTTTAQQPATSPTTSPASVVASNGK